MHVAVPFGGEPCELLVAAAMLHTFEMQDAAVMAEMRGEAFDPRIDAVEGIFDSFGLLEREDDDRRPHMLCGTPSSADFGEHDVEQARARMGHWGAGVEAIYAVAAPLLTSADLSVDDLAMYASALNLSLPRDARVRLRALVNKHAPLPDGAERPDVEMKRLERAARNFTLAYDRRRSKRTRTGHTGSPLSPLSERQHPNQLAV